MIQLVFTNPLQYLFPMLSMRTDTTLMLISLFASVEISRSNSSSSSNPHRSDITSTSYCNLKPARGANYTLQKHTGVGSLDTLDTLVPPFSH